MDYVAKYLHVFYIRMSDQIMCLSRHVRLCLFIIICDALKMSAHFLTYVNLSGHVSTSI